MVAIKENVKSRKDLLIGLYKENFPQVAEFVRKRGGSLDDARDIFQEAVIIYYEKALSDSEVKDKEGYLFGVARNTWFKKFRDEKLNNTIDLYDLEDVEMTEENPVLSTNKLLSFLTQSGRKCMEILRSFYYDQLSMKQLSRQFDFTSERSATVQKYKCLEKVRDQVKAKKMTYEDFFE